MYTAPVHSISFNKSIAVLSRFSASLEALEIAGVLNLDLPDSLAPSKLHVEWFYPWSVCAPTHRTGYRRTWGSDGQRCQTSHLIMGSPTYICHVPVICQ